LEKRQPLQQKVLEKQLLTCKKKKKKPETRPVLLTLYKNQFQTDQRS
jgi:hypothetical protein